MQYEICNIMHTYNVASTYLLMMHREDQNNPKTFNLGKNINIKHFTPLWNLLCTHKSPKTTIFNNVNNVNIVNNVNNVNNINM